MEMFLALFVFMLIGMALIYVLIGTMGIAAFLAVKLAIAAIYFIPTIIALYKKHDCALWIFLINIFLGFTFVGWIIALLWALGFDKTIKEFREFQASKNAKDAVIEGQVVKDTTEEKQIGRAHV